jgi:NAD-dependent oxidoreductase involved in siderophore biosynthesis
LPALIKASLRNQIGFSFYAKFQGFKLQGFLLQGALASQALVRGLPFWEHVRKISESILIWKAWKKAMELY